MNTVWAKKKKKKKLTLLITFDWWVIGLEIMFYICDRSFALWGKVGTTIWGPKILRGNKDWKTKYFKNHNSRAKLTQMSDVVNGPLVNWNYFLVDSFEFVNFLTIVIYRFLLCWSKSHVPQLRPAKWLCTIRIESPICS